MVRSRIWNHTRSSLDAAIPACTSVGMGARDKLVACPRSQPFSSLAFILILCCIAAGCANRSGKASLVQHIKESLPWTESTCREKYEYLEPDYSWYAQAQISESTFNRFCANLKLMQWKEGDLLDSDDELISWLRHPDSTAWWRPSENRSTTYYRIIGREAVFCKMEDGVMYIAALSH